MADEQLPVHRVAVVVFCTVDNPYKGHARRLAEGAVERFLHTHAPDGRLPVQTISGDTVTVQVHAVEDVVSAGLNGYLALRVTNRAYPREEHPDA